MPVRELQPYVVVRTVDETGSQSETRVCIQASTGRADGLAAAQLLTERLEAASSCTPVEFELRYPVAIQPPETPEPGSNVRSAGLLIFSTSEPAHYSIVEILGISPDLVDPDDPTLLLLSAPALQAYIDALISGIFCNPFGHQLVECVAGLYEIRQ